MAKRWRKEDDTYLKRYSRKRTLDELVTRFRADAEEVKAHLEELKLQTKDGHGYQEPWVDPALSDFENGLEAFHGGKIPTARKHFQVVMDKSDEADLRSRAQVYLDLCDARAGGDDDEKSDDPFTDAVVAKNRGDFEAAMAVCNAGGRRSKDERFAYLAATVKAAAGEEEEALALLRQAIEMNPENRVHAFHDSDFDAMRSEEEFEALFHDVATRAEGSSSAIES